MDQLRDDQVTRAGISERCWDHACEAHLSPRVPCHNRSYLSVGGEWIPSMNNRLPLIFLGEPRPPILQLISGFLILLIYGCISLWERQEYYSTLYASVHWRTAKCWVVLESQKNVNEGKCQKVCYKCFPEVSADTTSKSSKIRQRMQITNWETRMALSKAAIFAKGPTVPFNLLKPHPISNTIALDYLILNHPLLLHHNSSSPDLGSASNFSHS